jgi:hypothetical protein
VNDKGRYRQFKVAVRWPLFLFGCERDSKSIINRILKLLFACDVPLGCLDRSMSKQELNLFEFAAAIVAESGTSATKVVGRRWAMPTWRHTA